MCKRLFYLISCVLVLGFASGVASGAVQVLLDFEGDDGWTTHEDNTPVTETLDAPEGSTTSATWAIPSPVGSGEIVRQWPAPMDFSGYSYYNFYMKVSADPGNTASWLALEIVRDDGAGVWTEPISDLSPDFTVGEWFYVSIPFTTLVVEGAFPADFSEVAGVVIALIPDGENTSFAVSVDYVTVSTTPEEGMLRAVDLDEDPADGDTVSTALAELKWVLPDPNDTVTPGIVTCDVWFATDDAYLEAGLYPGDPNFTDYATQIVGDPNPVAVESVGIPVTLVKNHTYYWRIDTYDDSTHEPQPVIGKVFTFNTNNQTPDVDLGSDRVVVWLTNGSVSVPLTGVVTDPDGGLNDPPLLQWYLDDVLVTGETTEDIVVPLAATGEYVVRLTADDGVDIGEAEVTIVVYEDSCEAAKGEDPEVPLQSDFNGDCVTNLADFAEFAAEWLVEVQVP